MHVPLYNSNEAHFMEGESMRVVYESWFIKYKVDVIFAGHVHAYERSVWFSFPAHVLGSCTIHGVACYFGATRLCNMIL
jgi:hypothetical protein